MGVIVFGLESNTNIISIQMSGSGSYELSGELVDDDRIIVSRIPAGTYDIFKVKIIDKYHYIDLDDSEEQNWKMNIQPNKINYVGHFSLVKKGAGYRVQMKNDSTTALSFMEEHFSELLNKYALVYSKDGVKDEFFPYLKTLKEAD